jgi:hypothetical protein
MTSTNRTLGLGVALAAALTTGFFVGGSARQPAQAQPAAAQSAATGRYQLSSFTLQESRTPGAYILDTQTGDVFQVIGRDEPVLCGSAAKPQPRK